MRERRRSGFALGEIVAACGIVAATVAIVLPAIGGGPPVSHRSGAQMCLANEEKIGEALMAYSKDYDGKMPDGLNDYGIGSGWAGQIYPYTRSTAVFRCPLDEGNGVPPLTKGTPPDRASSYGYNANFTFVDPKHFGCMDQGDSLPISACTAPGRTILLFEVTNSLWYNVDTETNPSTLPGPNQGTRGGCGGSPAGDGIGGEYQPDGFNSVQNATGPDDGHLKFATGIPAGEVNPKGLLAFSSTGRHQVGGSNYLMADGHSVFLLASVISAGHNAPTSTSDAITDAANQYVAQAAGTSGHLSDGVTVPAATYSVY